MSSNSVSTEGRRCSKPSCKSIIPAPSHPEDKVYQKCETWRSRDQANTAARRNKRKLAEGGGQPLAPRVRTRSEMDSQLVDPPVQGNGHMEAEGANMGLGKRLGDA